MKYFTAIEKFVFGLTVNTTARYVSDRPANYETVDDKKPEHIMDSYWTCGLKIEQCLMDHIVLSLQGNNLFDEEYITDMANFTDEDAAETTREGYPGAGRSVFCSISYEY